MREQFYRALYNYSIEKLYICRIPLAVGSEDDIL